MGFKKNNQDKGNMYEFITYMYNPIRGICKHGCTYCYVPDIAKRFNQTLKPLFLDEKDLLSFNPLGHLLFARMVSKYEEGEVWNHTRESLINKFDPNFGKEVEKSARQQLQEVRDHLTEQMGNLQYQIDNVDRIMKTL